MRGVRETKRTLPGSAAVCGAVEQTTGATGCRAPSLILEPVARAVRLIYGEPLLVTSSCISVRLQFQPGLAAIR